MAPHQLAWRFALLLVSILSLWRGRTPERLAALSFVLATIGTSLAARRHDWEIPQWGILAIDVTLLVILVTLTLRYDRVWLLFASAFQFLSVMIHLAFAADEGVMPLPYMRGLVIWSYLTLLALAIGSWQSGRQPPRPPP